MAFVVPRAPVFLTFFQDFLKVDSITLDEDEVLVWADEQFPCAWGSTELHDALDKAWG